MASCDEAASLLLLELVLARVLPLDLVHAFFVFTLRVLFVLFLESSKGDRLHGGGTGWPQVRGRVSRIDLLLLDIDLARMLLLDQGNSRMVLH
jgi:hypothetical protein